MAVCVNGSPVYTAPGIPLANSVVVRGFGSTCWRERPEAGAACGRARRLVEPIGEPHDVDGGGSGDDHVQQTGVGDRRSDGLGRDGQADGLAELPHQRFVVQPSPQALDLGGLLLDGRLSSIELLGLPGDLVS